MEKVLITIKGAWVRDIAHFAYLYGLFDYLEEVDLGDIGVIRHFYVADGTWTMRINHVYGETNMLVDEDSPILAALPWCEAFEAVRDGA